MMVALGCFNREQKAGVGQWPLVKRKAITRLFCSPRPAIGDQPEADIIQMGVGDFEYATTRAVRQVHAIPEYVGHIAEVWCRAW